MTTRQRCLAALAQDGKEALSGKGGFWIAGEGFATLKQISTRYNIIPQPRQYRGTVSAYGDWATVAMLNGIKA